MIMLISSISKRIVVLFIVLVLSGCSIMESSAKVNYSNEEGFIRLNADGLIKNTEVDNEAAVLNVHIDPTSWTTISLLEELGDTLTTLVDNGILDLKIYPILNGNHKYDNNYPALVGSFLFHQVEVQDVKIFDVIKELYNIDSIENLIELNQEEIITNFSEKGNTSIQESDLKFYYQYMVNGTKKYNESKNTGLFTIDLDEDSVEIPINNLEEANSDLIKFLYDHFQEDSSITDLIVELWPEIELKEELN